MAKLLPTLLRWGKRQPDVSGCDPVLQDWAVLKLFGAGPVCQRRERNPGTGVRVKMGVNTQSLLLVGPGDGHILLALICAEAVVRVELEGLPRLAVVHALVDGHGRGLAVTEVE